MFNHFLEEIKDLENSLETYAVAMVVHRVEPSSGKPGDKALIRKDGTVSGWVGGGCTKGIILKEALAAMQDGKPRLVSIDKDQIGQSKPGVISYTMTCHSGGSVDVYIEPVLPRPHLVIMGKSQIAKALSQLGKTMNYQISSICPGTKASETGSGSAQIALDEFEIPIVRANTCIVVATQGEGDENALESALNSGADYIAFVASRKKANAIFQEMRARKISFDQLKKVKTPAGLDIHAKLPEEVAVSILAQIISHIRQAPKHPPTYTNPKESENQSEALADYYINPVCQVPVHKASAKHVLEYKGEQVYFCCDGCKVAFEKSPDQYL